MIRRLGAPGWMIAVIIILMLPVFQFPELLSSLSPGEDGTRTLLWCYPFYVVLTGWLAYACYATRPAVSWILLALMVLSHIAMFLLVTRPPV